MFIRIVSFLLGFGLMVSGCVLIIIYMNLLVTGYSFVEYVNFIIRRPAFYYVIIGSIILNLSIFYKGGNYEIYL